MLQLSNVYLLSETTNFYQLTPIWKNPLAVDAHVAGMLWYFEPITLTFSILALQAEHASIIHLNFSFDSSQHAVQRSDEK